MNPLDLKSSSETTQDAMMGGKFPSTLQEEISRRLSSPPFEGALVAVRSSGTDEDSPTHSFAGIYQTL